MLAWSKVLAPPLFPVVVMNDEARVEADRGTVRGDARSHTRSRAAAVASALACISGVATWVGRAEVGRRARSDELLAAPHFGAAKVQLRAEETAVTKQLYAAEDRDAKTGFRVAKDRALVHQLEQKAERISTQLKDPAGAIKPAREMMLARRDAFASVEPKVVPAAKGQMISLSDMSAIIKAVKAAEGTTSAAPTATAQPINLNIYLPGAAPTAAAAPAAAPTTAQIAAQQVKQSAALRLQLKAQDAQIHKLLSDAKPKQAATELSNTKIEAALSSAVSDMASHLHAENPIKLAAKLGVADPVALQEPAQGQVTGVTQTADKLPALLTAPGSMAPGTAAQTAAAKAAHLKKIEEMDGLLLKGKKRQNQLKVKPTKLAKARTQELADGSAREQLASAVAKEERMRNHKQTVQEIGGSVAQARTSELRGGNEVGDLALDQEESNSFFPSRQEGVRLPEDKASKLKHSYRSKMYELDRAAGSDAEHMKITGSIRDVIPDALFHAMNRQNAIHDMLAPARKHKGFPARQNSDRVFGHSVAGKFQLPSDRDVIKENNRMLEGLESAAGYQTRARTSSSSGIGDGWGEHYSRRDHDGWKSKRWLGDKTALHSDRPVDHGRIPVLTDGWGEHDADQSKASSHQRYLGLAGWKAQLKNSEHALGFKGLMAKQSGFGTRHTELEDAKTASRDGWLR